MNTIKLTRDPITGARGLHLKGATDSRRAVDEIIPAHGAKISPLVDGVASFPMIDIDRAENTKFSVRLLVDTADPADEQGLAHYNRILAYIGTHSTYESHEDVPPLGLTQVEQDVEAMKRTLAILVGQRNTIYDTLSLDITTNADGLITHHEFKCEKADRSEAIWVPNPIIGLIQKPNEKPCALLQFFDAANDLFGEVRCEVGTNQLAGFRKILANGKSKTRSYTAPQAEEFLHASESGGESG